MPTAVLLTDHSGFARSLIAGMQETGYFHVLYYPNREEGAKALLRRGDVQFLLTVPGYFSRKLAQLSQLTSENAEFSRFTLREGA